MRGLVARLGWSLLVAACGAPSDPWPGYGAPSNALRDALAAPSAPPATLASAPTVDVTPEPSAGPRPLRPDTDLVCAAPWRCTPHPRWRGKSQAEVNQALGQPFWQSETQTETEWHYQVAPPGCAAPSQRLVFVWSPGAGSEVRFKWSKRDLGCFPEITAPASSSIACGGPTAKVGPVPCPALDKLRGADEAAVLTALGVPHYAEGDRWTYRVPDGCADEREVTTVSWDGDRVGWARREHVVTGEHCEPPRF